MRTWKSRPGLKPLAGFRGRRRRGAVLVEYVLLSGLFFTFLFGTVEFVWIAVERQMLLNGAVAGAREAAIGSPLSTVQDTTEDSSHLTVTDDQIVVEYNSAYDCSGSWSAESAFDDPDSGDPAIGNQVPEGMPIRVTISGWSHKMLSGSLFNWLPGASNGVMSLSVSVINRRR